MALNEAKEKVQQLENAIRKLDAIKKHLSHSASDIKVEIHSCVSHNLEILRGREVSLLSKVDELVTLKEDALQQQQAKLNQALGVLQTRMAMMSSTDSVLDKQLAEVLTAYNEMDLSPGETPHIAFRADHMSLRECILNYGRVDSNALPLPSAFDDPGKPSASLPRHLEEYEDEDHHIFYKTVEELKESSPTSKKITVTIPKISTRIEDWLQKRQIPQADTISLARPKALPTQVSSSMNMSYCPTPKDTCSLNNWLSQIKGHADLEEEHNFEIVDNSHNKIVESTSTKNTFEDLKPWLHKSSDYLDCLLTAQKQSQNLFQHIPSDSKFWLHQSCGSDLNKDEIKQRDMFHHISKEPSTWLRTRAYGKQTPQCNTDSSVEKLGTSTDQNINQWLAQTGKGIEPMAQNENNNSCCRFRTGQQKSRSTTGQEKKYVPFQLEDICKANELCSTLIDCVCKPNCALQREQKLSGVKNPMDPTKVFNPPQLPLSQWLLSSGENSESCEKMDVGPHEEEADGEKKGPKDPLGKGMFSHIPEMSSDEWLFKPLGHVSESDKSSSPTFKHCKEEANLWLQQTHDFPSLETNAKVILNFNPSNKSLSEWLMSPVKLEVPSKDDDEDMMKEDSEGWSLCSSPATFSSEQFSKDVKVATSYMQDWVL